MLFFILISVIVFAGYALLIAYYHRAWKAMPAYSSLPTSASTTISIIIPVRNEAYNIIRCIDSLSLQSYPKNLFEIIIVDDHSTDHTWSILTGLKDSAMRILPVSLADQAKKSTAIKAYKKWAIETGIQAASGQLIVTTDADCTFHREWLATIAGFYTSTDAKFIAAPVKITSTNALLSIFQTLDFITLQGITGASVFKKIHSMCNGANLAYERKVFFEVDGFRDIDQIPSGDDMLLMYKVYKKYPARVFFLKNKQAVVSTQPEISWKGFINQRVRWASKADKYEDKRIFRVLLLVYLVNVLMLILFIASFWNSSYLWALLILLILKTLIEYPFVNAAARFFDQQKLMIYFPFFQPLHIVYTVVIGWLGKFGTYEWKQRKVG